MGFARKRGSGGTAWNREGRAIKMTLPVLIEERPVNMRSGGTARNREGRAIKMTLPVLIEERPDASGKMTLPALVEKRPDAGGEVVRAMAFVMPRFFQEVDKTPAPSDPKVTLRLLPELISEKGF
ncbi:hypothetical protein T484DRAFT_1853437 [Baffinella frigidus]|nr:hypothetical protein T484DRAFT_1853437 [Cryptophyta sp. CCMP2293]